MYSLPDSMTTWPCCVSHGLVNHAQNDSQLSVPVLGGVATWGALLAAANWDALAVMPDGLKLLVAPALCQVCAAGVLATPWPCPA